MYVAGARLTRRHPPRARAQTPTQIETIYNLGKAEAMTWAEEAGFLTARQERGWRAPAVAGARAAPSPKGRRAAGGEGGGGGGWRQQEGRR